MSLTTSVAILLIVFSFGTREEYAVALLEEAHCLDWTLTRFSTWPDQ
jgi:hypothetical protein